MNIELNLEQVNIIVYTLKIYFLSVCTFYTALKIINSKDNKKIKVINVFFNVMISIICSYAKYVTNSMNSIMLLVLFEAIYFSIFQKYEIIYSMIIISITLSINYIIFGLAATIMFFPNAFLKIQNDYISLLLIVVVYIILLNVFIRIKKFKNGFAFLQKDYHNEYFEMLILNISLIILFTVIVFPIYNKIVTASLWTGFIITVIVMYVTIYKSFQTYYKQKLLIKELEETKKELQEKKEEIEKLEKENLEISKTSHSISHKQKSLEHKINEILKKQETAEELDIKDRINNISKQLSEKQTIIELTKTNIQEIDDMLNYMQSECTKNKIDFQLQTNGNILSMTNNIISKEELEILLADHIKDAIIAIKYSDNSYKNILVRLGKIDGVYSIYIYDTGIEFETNTLKNLGKKPITTHKNDGGTGMGFINTFETLKKHKASLIIKEIGKPSKDDYTKIIIIKFDNKDNFIIDTYR